VKSNFVSPNIYVHSMFCCVCSSHDLCAQAHAHSLEETLMMNCVNEKLWNNIHVSRHFYSTFCDRWSFYI